MPIRNPNYHLRGGALLTACSAVRKGASRATETSLATIAAKASTRTCSACALGGCARGASLYLRLASRQICTLREAKVLALTLRIVRAPRIAFGAASKDTAAARSFALLPTSIPFIARDGGGYGQSQQEGKPSAPCAGHPQSLPPRCGRGSVAHWHTAQPGDRTYDVRFMYTIT